ncbi:MAG: DUF4262 domain-containing protein [Nitrospira sp.]|nr:MAG: DUF4262 domain-containing protein [Nitrospira sp.]
MDAGEQKALDDIATHGCHIINVLAEGEQPEFSYSVGIQQSTQRPEAIVIGLKHPIAMFVINEYNSRLKAGETFAVGKFYSGFIEGFDCYIEQVHKKHYREYFGWDIWLYKGTDFEVIQFVYPSTQGIWPWDNESTGWFKNWQPILTENGKPTIAT